MNHNNRIIIVAETGADISPELAKEYGIRIVPMHVTFGDVTKDDGSFDTADIIDYYKQTGKVPKTSGSNVEDFRIIYDEIHEEDPDAGILYMAYSAVTTCSYSCGITAAGGRDYVRVIDTKLVTVGQCAAVIRTAQLIRMHPEWTLDQAAEAGKKVSAATKICFLPKNLDFLRAGGRVSNAAAIAGNVLRILPRIDLQDGRLVAAKKYRGRLTKVIPKMIAEYVNENRLDRKEIWFGYTPEFTDSLRLLLKETAESMGFQKLHWLHTGGVITTHGGPCAFTLAGYQAEVYTI